MPHAQTRAGKVFANEYEQAASTEEKLYKSLYQFKNE
jgi:hypothetical protein